MHFHGSDAKRRSEEPCEERQGERHLCISGVLQKRDLPAFGNRVGTREVLISCKGSVKIVGHLS